MNTSFAAFHSLLLLGSSFLTASPKHQSPVPAGIPFVLDVEDPIATSRGSYHFTQSLLDLSGGPLVLDSEIFYSSDAASLFFSHLPSKFQLKHSKLGLVEQFSATTNRNIVQVQSLRGTELNFRETSPGQWEFFDNEQFEYQLHETTAFFYLVDPQKEQILFFEKIPEQNGVTFAFLTRLQDRNGNALTYINHPSPLDNGVQSISDNHGRSLAFSYATVGITDPKPYLQTITDHAGRVVTFNYEDNPADNPGLVTLRKIIDPAGGEIIFSYDKQNRITAKQLAEGNTPVTQVYVTDEFSGQTLSQTDAAGLTTTFEILKPIPGFGDTHFLVTYPDGTEEHYHHGNQGSIATAFTDALGKTMIWKPDSNNRNRIVAAQSRDGSKLAFSYHGPSGKIASETDRAGQTVHNIYTPQIQTITNPVNTDSIAVTFHNLTQINYPDGTSRQFTYSTSGNILSFTDRAGNTSTFSHDSQGRILTFTNAEGGITNNTYNAAGLLASRTDNDTGLTTFVYDNRSNPTSITRPDNTTVTATYDILNRLVDSVDEEGITTRRAYDANSNLTSETRAHGTPLAQTTTFEYDSQDRLFRTTDPAGGQVTRTFTHFDNVATITFEDDSTLNHTYSKRRNLLSLTDQKGDTSKLEYDKREHLSAFTSATGRKNTFARDPRGPVNRTIDASGDEYHVEFDAVARPIAEIDGLGRKTSFAYDGEGRLTSRTEPGLGTISYHYDGNGLLEQLSDSRNGVWHFSRGNLGRITRITDPNNRNTTRNYDNRGRLSTQNTPEGITETLAYNADSTLASRTFSDGLTHTFTHDALNRLISCERTSGGNTDNSAVTYDARNNVINTTVNGLTTTSSFDARSRLKTLTYPDGTIVTYTYDAAGLVTRISDNLTNTTIDFSYDSDRLPTQITRSNGSTTSYTYDEETLLQTVSHSNGATMAYTFNRGDEPISIIDQNFPLQTTGVTATTQNLAFNASSDITTTGFSNDSRGRRTSDPTRGNYTWDSDNRLISATKGSSSVTFRYDCLGRLTKRTLGANTTNYLYSSALNLSPIIGEQENGIFKRFYIALPDGQLLYFIDNPSSAPAPRFYHYGKTGNTRFLTDNSGAVSDSYRYASFGKLLQNSGSSDQIYTYVGKFGVRSDPTLELLHMRDRYYDPRSRSFISRDPIFEQLLATNNLASNPFQYALNSPLSTIDPTGREPNRTSADQLLDIAADVTANLQTAGIDIAFFDPRTGNATSSPERGSSVTRIRSLENPTPLDENQRRFLQDIAVMLNDLRGEERRLVGAAFLGDRDKLKRLIKDGSGPSGELLDRLLGIQAEVLTFKNLVTGSQEGQSLAFLARSVPVGPLLPLLLLLLHWQRRQKTASPTL